MPHLFDFYEDFKANEERLTISRAAKALKIPTLIIHGTQDETVSIEDAHDLKKWINDSELFILEGSDHVFEISHPWEKANMSPAMDSIVEKTSEFLLK